MNQEAQESRPKLQFGTLTLLIVIGALSILLALVSIKNHQDERRRLGLMELQVIGLNHSIGSPDGTMTDIRFYSITDEFSPSDTDRIVLLLERLGQRYDLGLTPGNTITEIDFGNSIAPDRLVERLETALPKTKIKR